MKKYNDEDWDFEEEDDNWKICKQILLDECIKMEKDKSAIVISGNDSYTMKQLYKEIENETDLGIKMIDACVRLKISKNK